MIKRIVVGLDPDSDTSHATDYAVDIAVRSSARVTGLAVVDEGNIEIAAAPELYMYKAPAVREELSKEARHTAREIIDRFETAMKAADVPYTDTVEEGVPFDRIVEDMKYHDLLVIGREPHFFYHEPERKTDDILDKIVTRGVCPVLVVERAVAPVNRVLIAYDGSVPAARAMQQFVQTQPFGLQPSLEIVNVRSRGDLAKEESALLLNLAKSYCAAHGFAVATGSLEGHGKAGARILTHAKDIGADLIVAGAHAVTKVEEWMFGSNTKYLLAESDLPLYLYH